MNLQRFGVVALAVTDFTRHIHIRQEVHFDALRPLALTRFTTAAFDIKAEPARLIAPDLRLARFGEHLPHLVKHAGVRRRITPRCTADRALIDLNHLVDLVRPRHLFMLTRLHLRAEQFSLEGGEQRLIDER